ncbi:MAG: methionine--tRNA ligase subunit beta, partial [Thermodesulfobacteriota bacterium]|nr:methionine--tRNA ligase subunit beta [Thermodesulfobacteriota bacterium]
MAVKYCDGKIPGPGEPSGEDSVLIEKGEGLSPEADSSFRALQFHKSLISIWDFINVTNKYIVEREPWVLAKDPSAAPRLNTVIYNILEALRVVAVFITPFMPETAEEILRRLGIENRESQDLESVKKWGGLEAGKSLTRGESLFPRVTYEKEEAPVEKKLTDVKEEISFEDFMKLDIRVAEILEAEMVPESSKLIKMKVDVGEERTIVAGMGKDYNLEELIGKKIAVVVNLKPTKIMGVESYGMLLAADKEGKGYTLVSYDGDAKVGGKLQ